MSDVEYSVFRMKFIRPKQQRLFVDGLTPQELMNECIDARPSGKLRGQGEWHVGNVLLFNDSLGYFRIGKTRPGEQTIFDDASGDFIEEEAETTSSSHVVFDSDVGLLGIAKNYQLAPKPQTLANMVVQLFSSLDVVVRNAVSVEADPIPDPDDFLTIVTGAYQVRRFTASFKGPNPIDADEYFQKPLSVYCQLAEAQQGKAVIEGDDLNREVVSEVARSSAATGNTASASVRREANKRLETVKIGTNAVTIRVDPEQHDPEQVAQEMRKTYRRIRKQTDSEATQ